MLEKRAFNHISLSDYKVWKMLFFGQNTASKFKNVLWHTIMWSLKKVTPKTFEKLSDIYVIMQ